MILRSMKLNRFYIYLGLSFAAVMFFVAVDFNFSKQLIIITDFKNSQPYVDTLFPPANVKYNLITTLPVFFKVHLPNYYDRVYFSLEAENYSKSRIFIGTVIGPQVNLLPISDDLGEMPVPHDKEIKYILTTSDGKLSDPVMINSLKLRFERDKLDLNGYLQLCLKEIQKLL